MNLSKINQWKPSVFVFLFLCSSDAFSGPGNIVSAARRFFNPKEALIRENSDEFIEEWVRRNPIIEHNRILVGSLREAHEKVMDEILEVVIVTTHGGVLDDTARRQFIEKSGGEFTDQEILEGFGKIFKSADRDSRLYDNYKKMIFERWWSDNFVRPFMFDLIGKEDLSSPDYLLKWWDEAKAQGVESRLQEYTRDFIENLHSEQFDPFGRILMRAVRENREWEEITESLISTPIPDRGGVEPHWDDLS